MKRRHLFKNTSLVAAGVALAACGAGSADGSAKKNFLFVHGAWHSSVHWNRVATLLSGMGHTVCAIDLPGAGLNASYPSSYLRNDFEALATEPSPLANIQLADYRDAVIRQIDKMSAHGKVTLVAHSLGGVTATVVAEAVPDAIERLVYVTALVPVRLKSIIDYGALPENAGSLTTGIWIADPALVGAARINPRSGDPAYLEKGRQAFYNDLTMAEYLKFAALLMPDIPLAVALADGRGTVERWGKVPRTFVRCTKDQSQPIRLQDLLIADADAATPSNKFDVKTLASSHSPFASMPAELATLLDGLA